MALVRIPTTCPADKHGEKQTQAESKFWDCVDPAAASGRLNWAGISI